MSMNTERGAYVREMFAHIAPRYDLANRVLTAGLDEGWRRRAIAILDPRPGARILDCAAARATSSSAAAHRSNAAGYRHRFLRADARARARTRAAAEPERGMRRSSKAT